MNSTNAVHSYVAIHTLPTYMYYVTKYTIFLESSKSIAKHSGLI